VTRMKRVRRRLHGLWKILEILGDYPNTISVKSHFFSRECAVGGEKFASSIRCRR